MAGHGVSIKNAARAGTLTYQWLPAATPRPPPRPATIDALDVDKVLSAAPSLVVLSFPSNDAMAGIGAGETVYNLLLLRRRALDRGAAVYVTSSQPRDDADATQRATMLDVDAALASQLPDCFVDVRGGLVGADGGIASAVAAGDGVHLNAEGHRRLFERLRAAIVSGRCTAPRR
jgi:lysophospholipase L1-like esterase